MAINFKVTLRQNPNEIHLRLNGDFDGSSACELLNILEKSCQLVSRVIIHTNGLRYIYPGNLPAGDLENTYCPSCGEKVVERSGFSSRKVGLGGYTADVSTLGAMQSLWRGPQLCDLTKSLPASNALASRSLLSPASTPPSSPVAMISPA